MSEEEILRYCEQCLAKCGIQNLEKSSPSVDKLIKCLPEEYLITLAKNGLFYLAIEDGNHFRFDADLRITPISNVTKSSTIDKLCQDSLIHNSLNAHHKMAEDFKKTYRGVELLSKASQTQKAAIKRTIENLNQIKDTLKCDDYAHRFKSKILYERLNALQKEFAYVQSEIESTKRILELSSHYVNLTHSGDDWESVSYSLQMSFDNQKEFLRKECESDCMNVENLYCDWLQEVNLDNISHRSHLVEEDDIQVRKERQRKREKRATEQLRCKSQSLVPAAEQNSIVAKVWDRTEHEPSSSTVLIQADPETSVQACAYPPRDPEIPDDECPVCLQSCRGRKRVPTCPNNHSVCYSCSHQLTSNRCPLCRTFSLQGDNPKFQ